MNMPNRRDEYLISKFSKLRDAAEVALSEIEAIPDDATVVEEFDAVSFAIAPVERHAQTIALIEAQTAIGILMVMRVKAWLAGARLDSLLKPLEIAA